MFKLLFAFSSLFLTVTPLLHAASSETGVGLEQQVAEAVKSSQVTVVHFWAPWCSNCHAEMSPAGWAATIQANHEVQFIFVNFWHRDMNPAPRLKAAGLGGQPNLTLLTHPVAASDGEGRATTFLGVPITWIPTTWVYRDGKLRYALNYGEIRFSMLQQLIDDARNQW